MSDHTTGLPTWDQMSDLDKGAAILHLRTIEDEGTAYATEHYPARYFDHPALTALDGEVASRHAQQVLDGYDPYAKLGLDEAWRLYDLASAANDKR